MEREGDSRLVYGKYETVCRSMAYCETRETKAKDETKEDTTVFRLESLKYLKGRKW